jgi:hypothetical protein
VFCGRQVVLSASRFPSSPVIPHLEGKQGASHWRGVEFRCVRLPIVQYRTRCTKVAS